MLNLIKKSKKLIIKGALKLKVFLVLFSLFFSSLALAAPLSVTWKGALIPGGNNNGGPGNCTATINGAALDSTIEQRILTMLCLVMMVYKYLQSIKV